MKAQQEKQLRIAEFKKGVYKVDLKAHPSIPVYMVDTMERERPGIAVHHPYIVKAFSFGKSGGSDEKGAAAELAQRCVSGFQRRFKALPPAAHKAYLEIAETVSAPLREELKTLSPMSAALDDVVRAAATPVGEQEKSVWMFGFRGAHEDLCGGGRTLLHRSIDI